MKNWKQRLLSLFLAAVLVLGCGTLPAGVRAADTAWRDGTYRGTGYGFHQGEIVLDVTVSGGEIEKVELVSQQGQSYWDDFDVPSIFKRIVQSNSPEVEVVSGATQSSNGVKQAVRNALEQAAAPEETSADVTALLGKNVNTENAQTVSYGGRQWTVIGYQGQGAAAREGSVTLLLKGSLGKASFDTDFDCDYGTSSLRGVIVKLAAGQTVGVLTPLQFTAGEKEAIGLRTLEPGTYAADGSCDGVSGKAVADQLVWPLSTKEALALNGTIRTLDPDNTKDQADTKWWLRSPGSNDYVSAVVDSNGNVVIAGKSLMSTYAIRPTFYLTADSVALVTVAQGGKGADGVHGLTQIPENTEGTWKLTLKDSAHSGFALGQVVTEGEEISLSYTGAVTGENAYISAAVLRNGRVLYYGRLKALTDGSADGTAVIDLAGITLGDNDKLYVFNEQTAGDGNADLSSALYEINTASKDTPAFIQQPVSASVEEGSFVEFKALASGDPEPEYTWQVNTGSGWEDIPDAEDYDYSISKVSLSQNGNKYRCVATNSHGTAYSSSATLTVTERQLETYVIGVRANKKAWGTITGGGAYEETEQVTVKAAANSGYRFAAWIENGETVSTEAAYTFTAAGDRTLTAVFEDEAAPGKQDYTQIYRGSGSLADNANTAAADTIWYGGKAWVVIGYHGQGVVSEADNMTLLAETALGDSPFSEYHEEDGIYYGNEYGRSTLRQAVEAVAGGFTPEEQALIQKRDLASTPYNNGYPYTDGIKGEAVTGALLWPLSPNEISNDTVSLNSTLKKTGSQWWLRSPSGGDYYAAYVSDSGFTMASGTTVSKIYGVRPAFTLTTEEILLLSNTSGGKRSGETGPEALTPALGEATDSWKLTVKDPALEGFTLGSSFRNGDLLTVSYSGAVTGENHFISAIVTDEAGSVKYYGRLKDLSQGQAEGDVEIDLSHVSLSQGDELYLFNEVYNGNCATDYAGGFTAVDLTAEPKPQEGFRFAQEQVEKTYGDGSFVLEADGTADGSTVTYSSSDAKVAEVEPATGEVTVRGAGTAVIAAKASAVGDYAEAEARYTLVVSKATVTVTVKDRTIQRGDPVPELKDGDPDAYTVQGLVNGDTLEGVLSLVYEKNGQAVTPDSSKAGTYDVAAFGLRASENYNEIVYKKGKLTVAGTTDMPFVDVASGAYYEDAVLWAVNNGVTAGTDETHFSPNVVCTRAQVISFLWRQAGRPTPDTRENPFKDVSGEDYYYKAVLWAVEQGITAGTDESHFSPNGTCTRAQVVSFLYRAAGKPAASGANPFGDVTAADYYYDAVLWAVNNGITAGTDASHFSPGAGCTRAQVVSFLYRAAE